MKRSCFTAILLLSLAANAGAIQFVKSADFVLPAGETRPEELWILAETSTVAGTMSEDCFAVAGTVLLPGTFAQDVWGAGETVSFDGRGKDDVRFAGKTVAVGGEVGGNLVAVGESVRLGTNSIVRGHALVAGETVVAEGRVDGGIRIAATSVTLSGDYRGYVRLVADDIVVMPGTQIRGDLTYTSPKELFLDQKVVLGGQLIRKEVPAQEWQTPAPTWRQRAIIQSFLLLCALVVGIPFVAIFPRVTGNAVRLLRTSFWRCALAGFAAFCLMPMLSVFALFTVIGLPLSLLLMTLYFMLIYLSKIVVALALGSALLRRRGHQPFGRVLATLVPGLFLLYVLASLPAVGGAVWTLIVFLGLGAFVLAVFSAQGPDLPEPPPVQPAASAPPPPPGLNRFDTQTYSGEEDNQKKE
jgi:cytoskeletal protein CcmA (bactofilin family)